MDDDVDPRGQGRVADEAPPPGVTNLSGASAYAAESVLEVMASAVPIVGGPVTEAYDKARARKDARAQHERDLFLYRLGLSLQAQVDRLGEQLESVVMRLTDPAVQDLIGQGADASAGKSDREIAGLADAVSRVIATRGDIDDAPALLSIVAHLEEGDITVLRLLVREVKPGDARVTADIARLGKIGAIRAHASLLRLDSADLVARSAAPAGETSWTLTRLGVDIATAMGESDVRSLPEGWTQADADLLSTLIEFDTENTSAIPSMEDIADRTGRTVADIDASAQVLDASGYAHRGLTMNGTPYASFITLDDSAYLWQAEQDPDRLSRELDAITASLRAVADGHLVASEEIAADLNLNPRLVDELFRRLYASGYIDAPGYTGTGPVFATPTEKLRRTGVEPGLES